MAIKKYYDSDCNLGVLDGKTVAVIGFGSQGHAHSENLAESGVNVVVGLRKGSAHWEKASEFAATHENFKVMEVEEAAKAGRKEGRADQADRDSRSSYDQRTCRQDEDCSVCDRKEAVPAGKSCYGKSGD